MRQQARLCSVQAMPCWQVFQQHLTIILPYMSTGNIPAITGPGELHRVSHRQVSGQRPSQQLHRMRCGQIRPRRRAARLRSMHCRSVSAVAGPDELHRVFRRQVSGRQHPSKQLHRMHCRSVSAVAGTDELHRVSHRHHVRHRSFQCLIVPALLARCTIVSLTARS